MKILKIVSFISLSIFSIVSYADTMNGNELLKKLTEKNADAFYYVVGIVDAADASRLVFELNLLKTDEKTRKEAITNLGQFWGCRPEKASYGQVVDVTIAYLNSHPSVRHLESLMLISAAMKEAWPCKAQPA